MKKPKKKAKSFPYKVMLKILERAHGRCENPRCPCRSSRNLSGPHHIFFKSQYFKDDRNQSWNGAILCEYSHRIMHHAGNAVEILQKLWLDWYLKRLSFTRYFGQYQDELLSAYRSAHYRIIAKESPEETRARVHSPVSTFIKPVHKYQPIPLDSYNSN